MPNDREEDWNDELAEEVSSEGIENLVVYSRDWTVETILRQIEQDNIDLNPGFQRRNAWNDSKRSKLIESLIIGVPVPEIVLAEDISKRRSFIVIDGKQRLLALAGFADPVRYRSWDKAVLRGLGTRKDLNGSDFSSVRDAPDDSRQFLNADIRCTVISNYKNNDVLYDIFYRLNTGSVPLSSQELRQVLNRGPFADFLIESTNKLLPLHAVLNLGAPDNRLRDAEILLRYIAFSIFGQRYGGNLTPFLDESMATVNEGWNKYKPEVMRFFDELNYATTQLIDVFNVQHVGRKFANGKWESRFNRALYEVEAFYFGKLPPGALGSVKSEDVVGEFEEFCGHSPEFLDSIETSTKNLQRYRRRYELFQGFVNSVFGTSINCVPLP
ncbi:MAG: DUF262 domain-containing protein [Rhodanobacter sp.]